jgi:hypothetical protein
MIKLLRQLAVIATVMFCAGISGATGSWTFYTTTVPYGGPIYTSPDGTKLASCHLNSYLWVYESDHFIIYSDSSSSDPIRTNLARMAETEFTANKSILGVSDTDLGINTALPSTKLHICSDLVGSNATGDYTGVSVPALDGSNNDPMDMLYCYAGYRNTLRHEMVHVIHGTLVYDYLSGATVKNELWFSEGLAVYLSDSSNLSSPGGILLDTVSLAAYFADGRPNPVHVKTRTDMKRTNATALNNNDVYPAFALAVKYLFDSTARGGAGNNLSDLKGVFQQIKDGTTFAAAFAATFRKGGVALTVDNYEANFSTWMTTYLSALQTPATITAPAGIQMAGIFRYRCDMIIGMGVTVAPAGNFALNVSELADGPYALCAVTDLDTGAGFGPIAVTVSGGKLTPTAFNTSSWPALSTTAIIPVNVCAVNSTGTINVMSSDVCPDWHAVSNAPWITITAGSSVSGNGIVTYSVEVNNGASRQGTMTINGDDYTVIQAAPSGNNPYKVDSMTYSYSMIQDAYNNLPANKTLQMQALVFPGDLFLGQDKTVKLQGGYGCDFTSNPGYTIVSDKITVQLGKVIIDKLIIK